MDFRIDETSVSRSMWFESRPCSFYLQFVEGCPISWPALQSFVFSTNPWSQKSQLWTFLSIFGDQPLRKEFFFVSNNLSSMTDERRLFGQGWAHWIAVTMA